MLKDQEKAITPSPKVGQGITMQYIGDKKTLEIVPQLENISNKWLTW